MPNTRVPVIQQRLKGDVESICFKCFHRKVCRAIDNQSCIECNQFTDANGVTVQKWIPVTERLPETFGEYIVTVQDAFGKRYSDYADYDPYKLYWRTGLILGTDEYVTHWMPLPEPPKGE